MRIGYRTIKTAVGTSLSVAAAQWLDLLFYASAGIITIICIKPTKKRSYRTAWERILASFIGLIVAIFVFHIFGYYPWTIALIILVIIPINVYLKAVEGIVTSTVIILHLYTVKNLSWGIVQNEIFLLLIGVGFALIVNLYMPNIEKQLLTKRNKLEKQFKIIFLQIADNLRNNEDTWSQAEIEETFKLLHRAKQEALRGIENYHFEDNFNFYEYFVMREQQLEIITHIHPIINTIETKNTHGHTIANFIEKLAHAIHPGNTVDIYIAELEEVNQQLLGGTLPENLQEFEARAGLLYFVKEMKRYLDLKKELMEKFKSEEKSLL